MIKQFTQDYNPKALMVQEFCNGQYGEISHILPFYINIPQGGAPFEPPNNQLIFVEEFGITSSVVDVEMSFIIWPDDTQQYTVKAEVQQRIPPDTFYKNTTVINNRFIKAIDAPVNVSHGYAYGYWVYFKEDVFTTVLTP